jgi:hypothetical protein
MQFICNLNDATGLYMHQQCEHTHAQQAAFRDILESRPVYALSDAYNFDKTAMVTLADGIIVLIHGTTNI